MKVLIFTKYSRLGASSRLRHIQYIPYYELNGINITVSPLFNDEYLQNVYQKKGAGKLTIFKCYMRRFFKLFCLGKYDKIIIEYELFPYLPAIAEWVLKLFHVKYIVDYDDAIFHNYDLITNRLIRTFLGKKIKYVMKNSFHVTAGNKYLASYAKESGAKSISIIPTVIDTKNYTVKDVSVKNKTVIGWIGSPSTLKYLKSLYQALYYLCSKYSIEIHIVGGKSGIGLAGYEVIKEWTESEEVEYIKEFDIGVMPLDNSEWARGKCGYKLIQYMGCGLPVVASPVGVNTDIIKNGYNGYLAVTQQEWIEKLEIYINNSFLRRAHGLNGRTMIEQCYNLNETASQMTTILLNK